MYIVSIEDREEAVYRDPHKFMFPCENHISGYLGAGVAVPVAPKLEVLQTEGEPPWVAYFGMQKYTVGLPTHLREAMEAK